MEPPEIKESSSRSKEAELKIFKEPEAWEKESIEPPEKLYTAELETEVTVPADWLVTPKELINELTLPPFILAIASAELFVIVAETVPLSETVNKLLFVTEETEPEEIE